MSKSIDTSKTIEEQILEMQAAIEVIAENTGLKNRLPQMLPKKLEELKARAALQKLPEPQAESDEGPVSKKSKSKKQEEAVQEPATAES